MRHLHIHLIMMSYLYYRMRSYVPLVTIYLNAAFPENTMTTVHKILFDLIL